MCSGGGVLRVRAGKKENAGLTHEIWGEDIRDGRGFGYV